MVVDVYLAPASGPCRAVLMTAKHIGVEVNQKSVNLMAGDQMKPEFLKMNPQHCVPTIDDNGFYLWESRAIQAYLVNKYKPDSPLYPKDAQKRAAVDRMLFFDIGTLYKAEGEYLYPQLFRGEAPNAEKEEVFKKALALLDDLLGKTSYVAGDNLTIADQSILASLSFAQILVDYDYSGFSNVASWLKKVEAELPYHKEINEAPLLAFKELMKTMKK